MASRRHDGVWPFSPDNNVVRFSMRIVHTSGEPFRIVTNGLSRFSGGAVLC